jgi:hypothetical protein
LGTFLTLDTAEVVAMIETRKMPALFPEEIEQWGAVDLTKMSHEQSIWKLIQIPVEVSWGMADRHVVWYGRVARIAGSLDPGTRTVPVIVEVPRPYDNVQPGVRPPLVPDVFCEVTAYGKTFHDVVVIPRDALHNNEVYLLRNGKLHKQPVTVVFREEDLAVISKGIETGDLVVLTDLFPASEGMPLRAQMVDNPIHARSQLDFPEGIFDETDEKAHTAERESRDSVSAPQRAAKPVSEAAP